MKRRVAAATVTLLAGGVTSLVTHGGENGHLHARAVGDRHSRRFDPHRAFIAGVSRSAPILVPPVTVVSDPPTTETSQPVIADQPQPAGWEVSSTAYCQVGTMADGHFVHSGAAAGNRWPLGTHLRIVGTDEVVVIDDRIGSGSDLDIWMASCADAIRYGRREVRVVTA